MFEEKKQIEFFVSRLEAMRKLGLLRGDISDEEYIDLFTKLLDEQKEKIEASDKQIDYNDEIVEIEFVGERETIDISVTGDNLFYCNGILTKNSIGIANTCDVMCSIWQTEEDRSLSRLNIGFIKNRFGPNFGHGTLKCNYDSLSLTETNSDVFSEEQLDAQTKAEKNISAKLKDLIESE